MNYEEHKRKRIQNFNCTEDQLGKSPSTDRQSRDKHNTKE